MICSQFLGNCVQAESRFQFLYCLRLGISGSDLDSETANPLLRRARAWCAAGTARGSDLQFEEFHVWFSA
jgi:hypothetical protein